MTVTEPTDTGEGPPAHRIHRATAGGSDDDARHPARRLRRALSMSESVSPEMPLAGGEFEEPPADDQRLPDARQRPRVTRRRLVTGVALTALVGAAAGTLLLSPSSRPSTNTHLAAPALAAAP